MANKGREILPLAERIVTIMGGDGSSQGICPKIDSCDYLSKKIRGFELNLPQAGGYLNLVCRKYYSACELNIEESEAAKQNGT